MEAYSAASKAVFEVFDDTTPLVEGLSIDEAFLDVGGLRRVSGTPTEIAADLRDEVRERVGLPITVGVARTKFLAKVASAVAKPDGLLVVAAGRRAGCSSTRCRSSGCGASGRPRRPSCTPGASPPSRDVARLPERALVAILGRAAGHHLHALAHNRDPRPVEVGRRRRSIGSQRALGRRPRSPDDIDAVLVGIVDRVTRRLRAAGAGRPHGRRCACASTTSPAPPGRTRCREPRPRPQSSCGTARGLLRPSPRR